MSTTGFLTFEILPSNCKKKNERTVQVFCVINKMIYCVTKSRSNLEVDILSKELNRKLRVEFQIVKIQV